MRITCDAYIEPSSQGARLGRAQNFRPAVCKGTSIAVDRDEVRRVLAQRATLGSGAVQRVRVPPPAALWLSPRAVSRPPRFAGRALLPRAAPALALLTLRRRVRHRRETCVSLWASRPATGRIWCPRWTT